MRSESRAFRLQLSHAAPWVYDRAMPQAGSQRGRVLVVDDHAPLGRAIARTLRNEADVRAETEPVVALELLASDPGFHLVLCDLQMPGMNGLEFLERLVAVAPTYRGRVVFLTGSQGTAQHDELLRHNVRVVNKPFDVDALRALVRAAIR